MSVDAKAAANLGRKWLPGGRGPAGGLDCLGLAIQVCDPPPPDVRSMEFDGSTMADCYEVIDGERCPGDLLIYHSIRKGKRVAHLSIVADNPGWCWTTTEKTGVVKLRTCQLPQAKAYRRKC